MKVAFATLGCKVNQYDTATVQSAVLREGAEVVPFDVGADVYVVNTCAVTDRADQESRRLARRARRANPRARVVLTGCYAQTSPAQAAALPEVDYVVGVGRLDDLLQAIRGRVDAAAGRVVVGDLRKAERVGVLGAEQFVGHTRAFLKVQEGCDLFCTFCIVPFARGRSRSVEPRRVLAELDRLGARGFHEVVLTGIHLGSYGHDLDPPLSLSDLIEMIAERAPVPRVRVSSVDPPEVTARLLAVMASGGVVCPHLHMPVQAGADAVLRRMRRRYAAAQVREVLAEIARVLPEAGLGTDVIAGFPGETEEDFAATLELLAGGPFTYLHVFPYSRRTGTTAAKLAGHLPAETIRRRARVLRRLGAAQRRAFAARWVGRELRVLVEERRDRDSGCLVGYSREYVRVVLDAPAGLANTEVRVRGLALSDDRLWAVTPTSNDADVGRVDA
jgi:threonylcarbamoyladenosine tRNA methylthiotransferase MtaB